MTKNGKFPKKFKSLVTWVGLDQRKNEQLFAFPIMKMESLDTRIFKIRFQW